MRISKKGEYALLGLSCLALNHGSQPLRSREIAARCLVPPKFLDIILLELKKHGLLRSGRGKSGGYTLLKNPSEVTLAEVIRIVDGPLAPVNCVSKWAYEKCPQEDACGLRLVMKDVRDAIAGILEGITLADLAARTPDAQRIRFTASVVETVRAVDSKKKQ